jgi:hypothetical protein
MSTGQLFWSGLSLHRNKMCQKCPWVHHNFCKILITNHVLYAWQTTSIQTTYKRMPYSLLGRPQGIHSNQFLHIPLINLCFSVIIDHQHDTFSRLGLFRDDGAWCTSMTSNVKYVRSSHTGGSLPGIYSNTLETFGRNVRNNVGRDVAQAVSRWLPTAAVPGSSPGHVVWDLWWTKQKWGRFYPSTSVSPAKHSSDCSTLIIPLHPGQVR